MHSHVRVETSFRSTRIQFVSRRAHSNVVTDDAIVYSESYNMQQVGKVDREFIVVIYEGRVHLQRLDFPCSFFSEMPGNLWLKRVHVIACLSTSPCVTAFSWCMMSSARWRLSALVIEILWHFLLPLQDGFSEELHDTVSNKARWRAEMQYRVSLELGKLQFAS